MGMMTDMAARGEHDPDLSVIDAVKRGDRTAFRELLRRNDRWVRGVIYGVTGDDRDVDDVVQQVWTNVWQRVSELRETARWRPWLYRMARNAAVDAGRNGSRRRRLTSGARDNAPGPGEVASPTDDLAAAENRQMVTDAIRSLPEKYREPLVLRHLHDWSYKQIAELLELPVDTVETRLVRARRMLRHTLNGKV